MTQENLHEQFEQKLHENYSAYINEWLKLEPTFLIEQAESIATVKHVFGSLTSTEYPAEQLEYFLNLENPLAIIAERFEALNDSQYFTSVDSVVESVYEMGTLDEGVQMC